MAHARKLGQAARAVSGYAESIVQTVREPLVVLNADLRVLSANRSFYETYRVPPEETENELLYELGDRQWDIPQLRELLEEILAKNAQFQDFEVEREFPRIGRRRMLLNAGRIVQKDHRAAPLILLAIEDITERKRAEERLRVSETRFRRLFEAAQDGILILDADTAQITEVNPFLTDLLGSPHEELVGKKLWEIGPFKHIEASRSVFAELQRKEYVRYEHLPLETKGGEQIDVEFVSNVYLADRKKVIQCNIRDISKRRRVEEQFRRVVESAPNGIVIVNREGKIVLANAQMEHLFGYSREELIAQPIEILVPERFRSQHAGDRAGFFADPHVRAMGAGRDLLGRRKDGSEFPVEIGLTPLESDEGPVVLGSIIDITKRKRDEETAKALAQVGRDLVESLDLAQATERVVSSVLVLFRATRSVLYKLDPTSGSLVCVATAGEGDSRKWIGQALPPGVGVAGQAVAHRRPIWCADLVADSRITLHEWAVERLLEENIRSVVGVPLTARGAMLGALVLAAPAGRVFTDEELRLLSIFADQAALAMENARLYGELNTALEEVKASQQQLVQTERLRAIEELAAGVAHHLNNLWTVILWRVQLLLSEAQQPEIRRSLEAMERTTLDGAELVRKLLGFTQTPPVAQSGSVDLNQLAQEVLEMTRVRWQEEAERRGIEIRASLEQGMIPAAAGEPALLREVLINLFLNAVEVLPQGGTITVKTWASGQWVYCSVADTGVGMSEGIRQRALEPFFTTKGPQRAGLGLSISYGIIQRHGGQIAIESGEGTGTAVTISLPQARRS